MIKCVLGNLKQINKRNVEVHELDKFNFNSVPQNIIDMIKHIALILGKINM